MGSYPHCAPIQRVEVARVKVSPAVSEMVPVAAPVAPVVLNATRMRLPAVLFDGKEELTLANPPT